MYHLMNLIVESIGKDPIAHEDSMTAWVNKAIELYGLTVENITDMEFGDKLDVIFIDGDIGERTENFAQGKKI